MDTLSFISSLIHDTATPIACLIGLWVGINNIPKLSKLVRSIKFKDFELILRDQIIGAEEAAREIEVSRIPTEQTKLLSNFINPDEDKILQLAKIDTDAAVAKIWQQVERKIIQLIQHNGLMRFTNPARFMEWLLENDKITKSEKLLFDRLRVIRNLVVHHSDKDDLSVAEVLQYREFADLLMEKLEAIRNSADYLNYPIPKQKDEIGE